MAEPTFTFEVLKGLPGEGTPPLQFSATGQGMHREGYVVRFGPINGEHWIGNFQPGATRLFRLIAHPNKAHAIVIAGGEAYEIDPTTRSLVSVLGSNYEDIILVPSLNSIVLSDGLRLENYSSTGPIWKTRRLSWDGLRNIKIHGTAIVGEAWNFDNTWHTFSVELATGDVTGGAYYDHDS